ncbi:hypothetical protein E1B28_010612 [Marasmius oreades]|uniref:Uncharacterized protein n=1 Tax=Marasmius oreades TaxID=181124 RepID=A0A9P7USV7_9AGAR|nr:uncharacterized protein E1B28_010612 [Marasmius oreades]KAG7091591.1 hypothetical protein E1B28_010612 [Marasmius oreades]
MRNMTISKAQFIALWMETLFFGINTVLFLICLYVLLRSRGHKVFLGAAVVMYALCTAHVVVDFIRGIDAFFGPEHEPMAYYTDPLMWSDLLRQALYITNILIADSLLIYRLYIIWGYTRWIVILPMLLLVGFSVSGYISAWLFTRVQPGQNVFDTSIPMCSLIGYAMSLSTNVIVTGLIAGRIWWDARRTSKFLGRPYCQKYLQAMAIVIESGAIISASLVVLVVLYSLKFNATYVTDSIAQITGIAPTLIIVRVGMGCAVESDRDQSENFAQTELSSIRFVRNSARINTV